MIPLPIDPHLPGIVEALGKNPCLALTAPPGAGKTTRLPPALLAAPWMRGTCLVLEPRRIAARAAARRVAEETGTELGALAGYQVRGESKRSASTRILFCTEGILTARLQSDPFLEGVGAVILDEFHERSLDADLALGMLAEARAAGRGDLRLVACSATLDPGPVASYLRADTVEVPGKLFPVEIEFLDKPPPERLDEAVAQGVRRLWPKRPDPRGDLLVFLPGAGEIRRAASTLEPWAAANGVALIPLHGDLAPEAQDAALTPCPTPRVILSTNVAETSLTLPSVCAVVDAGLVKLDEFDAATGLTRLAVQRASRASATQRAGRAGRTGPGVALRLWTRHDDESRPERLPPEIQRADLSRAVLELASWGHPDPAAFGWFEAPGPQRLEAAQTLLREVGAVDAEGRVTPDGAQMLRAPLHPRFARLFLDAARLGLAREAAALAAVAEERDLCAAGRAFGRQGPARAHISDLLLRVELLEEARTLRFQPDACRERGIDPHAARAADREASRLASLARVFERDAAPPSDSERERMLLRLVFRAFPDRLARAVPGKPGRYLLSNGRGAELSERSAVSGEPLLVALRLDAGRRGERALARIEWASAVEEAWLAETGRVQAATVLEFDASRGRVAAWRVTRFGDLELSRTSIAPDPADAASLLASQALADPLAALRPEGSAHALLGRIGFLAAHGLLPPWGEEDWRAVLEELAYGKTSLEELRGGNLVDAIRRRLGRERASTLDREAPEALPVPSGSRIRLDYPPGAPPVLAVKIQEVFGLRSTPRVAGGSVPVVFHLLGPHGRPLQVTGDLESFWKNAYPEVRKEMRGRYPRHNWPEDPLAAPPSRRTLKKPPR